MPVETWVAWAAMLFVSSASKIALFGSTVTVFVIGADERRRATTTIVNVVVDSGGTDAAACR